ncbi:Hypothetical protein PBC10988_11060 [Planctomycetales bacterium 10988]|nr:Hypothetical protein PBC10988_11060 [Planctomycetales bacterium 10988]
MSAESRQPRQEPDTPFALPPPLPFKIPWLKAGGWLLLSCLMAVSLGAASAYVQGFYAPILLAPILWGLLLGGLLGLLAWWLGFANRRFIFVATLLAVVVMIHLQHFVSYQIYLQSLEAAFQKSPAALVAHEYRPDSWWDFMKTQAERGRSVGGWQLKNAQVWAWWVLDGILSGTAALIVVWQMIRLPYSTAEGAFYREIRQGELPKAAKSWLQKLDALPQKSLKVTYRLLASPQMKEPFGLEIRWEGSVKSSKQGNEGKRLLWLDREQLRTLETYLDH